jgi:hypothetical protein
VPLLNAPRRSASGDATPALYCCGSGSPLPGVRLYAARGYLPGAEVLHPLGPGLAIQFVPMSKEIAGT